MIVADTSAPHTSAGRSNAFRTKGLAQAIAGPAYERMLVAEPYLRRAIPILIISFIATIFFGTLVGIADRERHQAKQLNYILSTTTELLSSRLEKVKDRGSSALTLSQAMRSPSEFGKSRFLLIDKTGTITDAVPDRSMIGQFIEDATPTSRSLSDLLKKLGLIISDPNLLLATRPFGEGYVSAYQIDDDRTLSNFLTIVLSATTSFVVLILGFAFHWQSRRAREGDEINDIVRQRIETALLYGQSGLWDWDIAKKRVFWSESMFKLLELSDRGVLLTEDDVSTLMHPADAQLSDLASAALNPRNRHIDTVVRMRHTFRGWTKFRIRAGVRYDEQGGAHLIGAAVEIPEQTERKAILETQTEHIAPPKGNENLSKIDGNEMAALTDRAQQLSHSHLNQDGGVDLFEVATELGARVFSTKFSERSIQSFTKFRNPKMGDGQQGSTPKPTDVRAEIYLERAMHLPAKRWQLAKELARVLAANTDLQEQDLTRIALSLVLPTNEVKLAWERLRDSEALAEWFQVPTEIARARINELQLEAVFQ